MPLLRRSFFLTVFGLFACNASDSMELQLYNSDVFGIELAIPAQWEMTDYQHHLSKPEQADLRNYITQRTGNPPPYLPVVIAMSKSYQGVESQHPLVGCMAFFDKTMTVTSYLSTVQAEFARTEQGARISKPVLINHAGNQAYEIHIEFASAGTTATNTTLVFERPNHLLVCAFTADTSSRTTVNDALRSLRLRPPLADDRRDQ